MRLAFIQVCCKKVGQEETALRTNVVALLTTLLNDGSYNSFDKPWTQYVWRNVAKLNVPQRQTARNLMRELGNVVASVNLERLVRCYRLLCCLSINVGEERQKNSCEFGC